MTSVVFGVVLAMTVVVWTRAELFTAIEDMKPLFDTLKATTTELQTYLDGEMYRIDALQNLLNYYTREEEKIQKQGWEYLKNPLNTFSIIKRLTLDLESVEYFIHLKISFNGNIKNKVYPSQMDLEGAVTGLWRLQQMYSLNVSQLVAGQLEGNFSHNGELYSDKTTPMTVDDCLTIGIIIYEKTKDYGSSIIWFKEALNKYYNKGPDDDYDEPDESIIVDYLRNAYYGFGDFANAIYWTKKLSELRPIENYAEDLQLYERRSEETCQKKPMTKTNITYRALCRGEIPLTEQKIKGLRCYYKSSPAFLRLARVKTELLHQNPDIYRFYDVISDDEIEHLKNYARPKLERAAVYSETSKTLFAPSSNRISKRSWGDDSDLVTARISARVRDLTELSTIYSERLQLVNYGVGGHYIPHFDFHREKNCSVCKEGNRYATVLFYMTDVEQGGATVFLDLNITVYPIKNSAIYWMNLHRSCRPDFKTMHAACPVLAGSKWVATKWLRQHGQELISPCTLKPNE